ncbi:heavy metal translocating P-type ATPase [Maritimibacter fusiformis]|uniref:Cation-translocating P-type ATPase n=1 Tax=Maritimibacter fusiformis TaxID=2603819 RepID=A0A5D0RKS4_9RHOB|nr:cation-translocating P-type ATPase [Maritimibacter fusiformis]TYB81114.1 cation-translocating P-type ATPase [Maritimibacter fusiformis]
MTCQLCGLPTPSPPFEADGKIFCCPGCRQVFLSFGEDILANRKATDRAEPGEKVEGAEAFLRIEGMHCSSCEVLIDHMAERIDGIHEVRSSYATSTARVSYDPEKVNAADLPELLSTAGYKVTPRSQPRAARDSNLALLRVVAVTSLASVVMMLNLAFFYPSHLGLVDAADLEPVHWLAYVAAPLAIFVLTSVMVGYVGLPIYRGALVGLRAGVLNMDNLLAIAILSAYAYSSIQYFRGNLDELYFDVAAAILTVVTVGRYFEAGARETASHELEALMDAWTPVARVTRDGRQKIVPLDELHPGEPFSVGPGEAIPLDGIIQRGSAAVDASLLTGEPFPVRLGVGDRAQGGTIVVEGEITLVADAEAESQLEALTRILWDVQSSTVGARGFADRVARAFVPAVLMLAATVSIWVFASGGGLRAAVLIGLTTLIVSCPCTFGLATPLATAAGVSAALRRGIIFTSADIFDRPRMFDTIIFDKTGTLSTGEMSVVSHVGPPEAIARAAAVERRSRHPIAEAIARLDQSLEATEIEPHPGRGVVASVDGVRVAVGSRQLFANLGWEIPDALRAAISGDKPGEDVVSFVGWEGRAHGAFKTRDTERAGWRDIVERARRNTRVVLLSGAEHAHGYEDAFDEVHLGVPPEAKAAIVRHYRGEGTVAMIGDGSNDAPALAEADLSVAFGTPTALAAEAADIVIPGDDLNSIPDAFMLAAVTRRRIKQNLGWALLYNATAIPLAVLGLLNPLFAALAMSSSSLLVVWNSTRGLPKPATILTAEPPADSTRNKARLARL